MDNRLRTRTINVLLFDDVNLLDVAGPVQAFEAVNIDGRRIYQIRFVSLDGLPARACCGLRLVPDAKFASSSNNDDLLIPGGKGVDSLVDNSDILELIREHAGSEGRLVSVCSGALVLAAAGVLDGLEATTHWSREDDTRNYPSVSWNLDSISITQGNVSTSAGVTTGIDLALAVIQEDCGHAVALEVARELVVQLRRTGGQSQYAVHLAGQFTKGGSLTRVIEQVVSQPNLNWSLETLADAAGLNTRTLSRHFKRDLGETPAQFVEKIRVDHARNLLSENVPLKRVAVSSGFGDLQRMRRAFQRRFGVRLGEYRTMFR